MGLMDWFKNLFGGKKDESQENVQAGEQASGEQPSSSGQGEAPQESGQDETRQQ